ncbi:MAG: phytoene desaturase [Oligoflexus sp.]
MSTQKSLKNIAVIGSGFGGLAAAIRLQAQGWQTTLFDQRDKPGGRAYRYEIDGFKFDAGPTVVTVPECIEELFQLAGKNMADYVELMPVEPFYRLFWEDGVVFDYVQDHNALLQQIAKISPQDVGGYEKFYRYAEEVYKAGYEELCHVPFLKFSDMVKAAPDLVRLGAYRTVYQTIAKYVKDEHLRQAFSFNSLLIGGNPFRASAIYTLIHPLERKFGVWFPKGGTFALVEGLVKLFQDIGGKILLNAKVEQILTDHGRVSGLKLAEKNHAFDAVVSNADVTYTYEQLLRQEPLVRKKTQQLLNKRYSMSLFLIYFGTKKRFPGLVHHNIFFANRYKALLNDIFDRGVLADDFSLYLHAPTVSDPSLAPEGGEAFYVLAPVPHLGKANIDWEKVGPQYADRILNYLDQRYVPGLKKEIVVQKIFSPQDFKSELNAHLGSAFSLEPTLTQSAWFRPHNRDERLAGLYIVGAGTHPGAGIPGVIGSAKATVSVIMDDVRGGVSTDAITMKQNREQVWQESPSKA